eukprot:CAMPEP_0206429532 /NCGR_PEP_ID=MMETSP0324_2-20121206/6293_1 /ASSEMBLY_ACC=CAM_ASM_000836 /TAXON_ID=2866 /ORGANISM="Crypthecodinium cohnii, Strain Seligo" /LENGTH=571 /DNA_ID=CAMNT_0053895223 /DNA_START=33 /DNA_END=1745 /DNA_ORIENTATION=+
MIDYQEDWLLPLVFKIQGSVYYRSLCFALPSSAFSVGLILLDREYNFREDLGMTSQDNSVLWSAVTAVLLVLVGFRSRQGLARFWEGTGLLHQMKGEWFDTVSNCVTFTIASGKKDPAIKVQVDKFRHTIVRLMSLCHGSALEEISGMHGSLETIDVMGLNTATLKHVKDCVENHHFNKVEVLLHLVQSLITDAHEAGVIQIPPPILSRVYQTISRGYVNLLNTKKITDTKFPFPYVQLITFLLILHTIMAPVAICSIIDHLLWAPIFCFIPVFGSHALNFIAMELEDPFGEDDNDLPLAHFQAEMNNCLLMLLHPNTDIIANVCDTCVVDFEELKKNVTVESAMADSNHPKRRTSIHLFDPSFKFYGGSSQSNLETVIAMIENQKVEDRPEDGCYEESASFDCSPPEEVGGPDARVVLPDRDTASTALESAMNEKRMDGPGKRLHDPRLTQNRELELLLAKSLEDFNSSLKSWSQKMEEQVRDMGSTLSHIGSGIMASSVETTTPGVISEARTDSRGTSFSTAGMMSPAYLSAFAAAAAAAAGRPPSLRLPSPQRFDSLGPLTPPFESGW